MSSLFGLNKPNTNLRKNVFDLSEKTLFSMSAGMLLPVMTKELNPGEKIKLSLSSLTRTQPLNTAAFVRNRQYFHVFFVPYRQLWSYWDNFIYGVDYRVSALQKGNSSLGIPRFNLFSCLAYLIEQGKIAKGAFARTATDTSIVDELGYPIYRGISRLLDMLGYGFAHVQAADGKVYSTFADVVEGIIANKLTVADLKLESFYVNIFRLLAYQKIYSDFYKRDDYEATTPAHFNIDDVGGDSVVTGDGRVFDVNRLVGLLSLRYRWQPKDYYTGVVPSELGPDTGLAANTFGLSNSAIGRDQSAYTFGNGIGFYNVKDGSDVVIYDPASHQTMVDDHSLVSTRSIRSAFAIEKILRLTRRAGGYDYISQTAAHFGFEPPKGRGSQVEFLGGFTSNVNISEVVTTANTDEGFTGQIYGRGIGSLDGSNDVEYTAKEHGVLMCIASVVPDIDYSSEGLDRFNAKFWRADYFQPELQDLGLQPVYGYEYRNYCNFGTRGRIDKPRDSVLGFAPRYAEYKTSYDRLHGEFRNGHSMAAWSGSSSLDFSKTGVNINSLKIDPRCLNRVFSIQFDGSERSDQFLVSAQFITKVIRPMSITGQGL